MVDKINSILKNEFGYSELMECVRLLADKYDFLQFSYLTESVMGKGIPHLAIGEGEKEIYYVGAHHGAERITSALLIKFVLDMCILLEKGASLPRINLSYVLKSRTIHIIPMLNPDGVDISLKRLDEEGFWYKRVSAMNGSEDFSLWQANANGVDLNHNYDAGFAEYKNIERDMGIVGGCATRFSGEKPESEPESGALCNYLRFNHPTALMTLHTQGEEIYYTSGGLCGKGAFAIAAYLSRLTGYKLSHPSGAAAYGGLTDFCIQKLFIPSFTIECGKGKNPLPQKDLPFVYSALREALFTFPTMF